MKSFKRFLSLFLPFFIVLSLCGSMPMEAKGLEKSAGGNDLDALEVHFIDVGQGDAALIKCGDAAMLIDAGENDQGTLVQNYIRKQGVKSLDYLIVTHPHSDHCGGADVIISKYDIDTIIMPNYSKDTATYRDVIKAMDYKGYEITSPEVGDSYKLGDAEFTIIAPNKEDYGDDENNYSVGIILEHGSRKFVFTGDAEEEAEADIVDNGIDISADVLKIAHHGSRTSSTEEFIRAVKPEYAVISCGENNEYGHPHAATLNTLRGMGVKVFRTDEQGSLIAASDGKEITWNAAPSDTWKAGEPTQSSVGTNGKAGSDGAYAGNAAVVQDNDGQPASGAADKTAGENKSQKEEPAPAVEEPEQAVPQDTQGLTYILNVKTKKFHVPSCSSLPTTNRSDSALSRDEIIAQGYVPCKRCNP